MGREVTSKASAGRINVWIADDDQRYCTIVTKALNESKTIRCERQFCDLDSLLAALRGIGHRPDVILLDVRLHARNGLDYVSRIRDVVASKVVVLTAFDNDSYVLKAFAEGVHGFFLKDTSAREITEAIVEIARGGIAVDQRILPKLVKFIRYKSESNGKAAVGHGVTNGSRGDTLRSQSTDADPDLVSFAEKGYNLTETEKEIIRIAIKGGGQKQMADELNRSIHTVHTHLKNIFWKMGVHSLHALVAKAIIEQLL